MTRVIGRIDLKRLARDRHTAELRVGPSLARSTPFALARHLSLPMRYHDANRCCDLRDEFLSLMVQEEMIAVEEHNLEALRMRQEFLLTTDCQHYRFANRLHRWQSPLMWTNTFASDKESGALR